MIWDWSTASENALQDEAHQWSDQYPPDHPGYCDPAAAYWHYDPHFDLSRFGDSIEWARWFDEEQWLAEQDDRSYADLLTADIQDPIVVLIRDGQCYVWDGCHRIGAACKRGLSSLRAIVGMPFSPKKGSR